MSDDCMDIERIPDVLDLPLDDSWRRHVEGCPRCSAILASYRAFVREEAATGADPENADSRLTAFLASKIGAPGEAAANKKEPLSKRLLSRFTQTASLRPVWVSAVLVIVAASLWWWQPWTEDRTVLRGTKPAAFHEPLDLKAPQKLSRGAVRLEWMPMPGADSYQVCIYDQDLQTVCRLEPTRETTMVVDRHMLPADTPSALIWRVVALERGDEIGWSEPAPLELP